jgi:hypothetical protein
LSGTNGTGFINTSGNSPQEDEPYAFEPGSPAREGAGHE